MLFSTSSKSLSINWNVFADFSLRYLSSNSLMVCSFNKLSINKDGIFIPALFTNTSILPKVSLAFCTVETILYLFVTSILAYNILPLFSFISNSGSFGFKSHTTTFAPVFKNSCATAFLYLKLHLSLKQFYFLNLTMIVSFVYLLINYFLG